VRCRLRAAIFDVCVIVKDRAADSLKVLGTKERDSPKTSAPAHASIFIMTLEILHASATSVFQNRKGLA
jgi:hypothetical protein